MTKFKKGDRVTKVVGDYQFVGTVLSVFEKLSGAIRCNVEDDRGCVHIFNEGQMEFVGEDIKMKFAIGDYVKSSELSFSGIVIQNFRKKNGDYGYVVENNDGVIATFAELSLTKQLVVNSILQKEFTEVSKIDFESMKVADAIKLASNLRNLADKLTSGFWPR